MADDLRTLTIFIYSHGKTLYQLNVISPKDSFSFWPLVSFTVDKNIASVIQGDFNYDGQLDLLVITVDSTDSPNSYLQYYFRTQDYPFFGPESGEPDVSTQISGQTQPFILDTNGDRMYLWIFTHFLIPISRSDFMYIESGSRKVQTISGGDLQAPYYTLVSLMLNFCIDAILKSMSLLLTVVWTIRMWPITPLQFHTPMHSLISMGIVLQISLSHLLMLITILTSKSGLETLLTLNCVWLMSLESIPLQALRFLLSLLVI